MILINNNIADNFNVMIRGFIRNFIWINILAVFLIIPHVFANEKIGIISDTLLTPVNYYNAYFKTPEFFPADVRSQLLKKNVQVVPIDDTRNILKKAGLRQNDLEALQGLQQGYNVDYQLLKKISKTIGVKKIVIVTMGIDVQRDFLKNTIWNVLNISGKDVVNPTHRVSVYCAFVDIENENVLWESIYAKNIRNNKFKNLDTTVSNNYEGMLRLKEYSKYISPDIAYNVKMRLSNPNYIEPPTAITRKNIVKYAKDKHNIGVKKELSEIDKKKWDGKKLVEDSKDNVITVSRKTKNGVVKVSRKTGNMFSNLKNKIFRRNNSQDWL